MSGSSLLTLGFAPTFGLASAFVAFSEAAVGLVLVALLISYLPTMYAAFARREAAVTMLEARAGNPPSCAELLERAFRLKRFDRLPEIWPLWEAWFVELEESHTSLAAISFFRSPEPHRSWVTAAGAVLDTAALSAAALEIPSDPQMAMCSRAGAKALMRIADFFGYSPRNAEATPGISVKREEFLAVLDRLARQGLPVKAGRDQAWREFEARRVVYDKVLLFLAGLTMAPPAPWSSDRLPERNGAWFLWRDRPKYSPF